MHCFQIFVLQVQNGFIVWDLKENFELHVNRPYVNFGQFDNDDMKILKGDDKEETKSKKMGNNKSKKELDQKTVSQKSK